jgi:hypothetical protein
MLSQIEMLKSIIPSLSDAHESNPQLWVPVKHSVEEYESLRQQIAALCAEGLMERLPGTGFEIRLTPLGHSKFSDLNRAVLALGN